MKFSFFKNHRNDIILISIVLIIAIAGWMFLKFNKSEGGYVVVTVNGIETENFPLNEDKEITLTNGDGYNILVIKDGSARIKEASCPDKLCVKQHEVKYNGEALVCLPNKTTVKVVSDSNPETDFIS